MTPIPSFNTWLAQQEKVFEALCLDIDGVLLNGKNRLPGSRSLLDLLRRKEIPFVLLTNDGNHATEEKSRRLQHAGLAITADQIISCGHAIALWAAQNKMNGARFFVMGDTGTPCFVEAAGLKVTHDLQQLDACSGVVVGEDQYQWEPVINAVINFFINHPYAPLVVPNPDEFYPGSKLKIHVAAGGVGRFIQQVLNAYGLPIEPIYLGKPYPPIFELALEALEDRLECTIFPEKVLVLGDNLEADIKGGKAMGHATALMLTGVTSPAKLNESELIPDMVFSAL